MFTGKGGVGKTTVAAATAVSCARSGRRTLAVSTDPAHSLGDAFGSSLGDLAVEVEPGLHAQELDARARMEESWEQIRRWLLDVFSWAGVEALEAEELAVLPGLDEVFALADLFGHARSGGWDTVVVDCAPTAETLRLLSLPEVVRRYMQRLFPAGRKVNKVVAPLVRRVSSLPVAPDGVFAATESVYAHLEGARALLGDPSTTSVRLVVNPERMVIAEARRTHTHLCLFGYDLDAVVANRLLPEGITDPWFAAWKALHAEHLNTVEESFAPIPVLRARLAATEIVGPDALAELADEIYGDLDPSARLFTGEGLRFERQGDRTVLQVPLPGASSDDVELSRGGGELLVGLGPYRRSVALPDSLWGREVLEATLRRGTLRVVFETGAGGDGGRRAT